jgi:hypothetical protein
MDEKLLDAARALRGDIDQVNVDADVIVGFDEDLDRYLADVIERALSGEDVERQLRALLWRTPDLARYTDHFLAKGTPPELGVLLGYSPVPGPPNPVPLKKYSCPQGDYDWYQRNPQQPVPVCPTHKLHLVPAD